MKLRASAVRTTLGLRQLPTLVTADPPLDMRGYPSFIMQLNVIDVKPALLRVH